MIEPRHKIENPEVTNVITFYPGTDHCDRDGIETLTLSSVNLSADVVKCNRLLQEPRIWSIRINGSCVNIEDQGLQSACQLTVSAIAQKR